LRRHTDVAADTIEITVVASKTDPGGNDVFDVRNDGTIIGVGELDCDFQKWTLNGYAKGYRYLTVLETVE
jgi:hypothetical protein